MSIKSNNSATDDASEGCGCLLFVVLGLGAIHFAAWLTNPPPSKHAAALLSPEFQYNGLGELALGLAKYKYRSELLFSYVFIVNDKGEEEKLSFGMFGIVRTFERSEWPRGQLIGDG